MPERFPPPWTFEDKGDAFAVSDAAGFTITWFHYAAREVIGTNPDRLTKRQALAFAKAFVRLPELLGKV